MERYDVRNRDTGIRVIGVSAEEAARIMGIDPADLEWAIEEEGRCDTDTHTARPHRPPGRRKARAMRKMGV